MRMQDKGRRSTDLARLTLGAWVLCSGSIAHAQPMAPPAQPQLDLATLVKEAQASNPAIRAAEQRLQAARAMIPQARTLPDPMVNLGYEDMDGREAMYGVSQEFPFPGKLRLRGEVASREAEQMAAEYESVRLEVTARLKEAYYELYLAHKAAGILQRNRQLLTSLADTAQARYQVGQSAQADVLRAQAEVSRLLAKLAELRQQRQSLDAQINGILNRPATDPLGVPEEITAVAPVRSLRELAALAGTSAPRLRTRAKAVERGQAAVELARREYLPDFEIAAQGLRDPPMGEDGYRVMFNVTVPLFYASKQRYGVREAIAGRDAAADDLQDARQELTAQVIDHMAQIERSRELIDLFWNAILPQARATLDSARASYTVGKVDFLTVLSSLLTLQESELELHEQIVEHEKARARLEAVIGESP